MLSTPHAGRWMPPFPAGHGLTLRYAPLCPGSHYPLTHDARGATVPPLLVHDARALLQHLIGSSPFGFFPYLVCTLSTDPDRPPIHRLIVLVVSDITHPFIIVSSAI
jgi:hypothetical protein